MVTVWASALESQWDTDASIASALQGSVDSFKLLNSSS
jgi:hypothetical protein